VISGSRADDRVHTREKSLFLMGVVRQGFFRWRCTYLKFQYSL
jgi:hypothetical protein